MLLIKMAIRHSTVHAKVEEMRVGLRSDVMKLESKVENVIDRRCEEMNRSFEMATSQLTSANAETTKCISKLSSMMDELSSKVSSIEDHLNSKEDKECNEELCNKVQRLIKSDDTAWNEKMNSLCPIEHVWF